ncbi:MAG: hypothetical protein ACOCW2_01895, partial [Chitinivibrionales bacterium]
GEIIKRHSSPSFKFASKNFYSCFVAAAQVASEPGRYFQDLVSLPPYKTFTIKLRHPVEPTTLSTYLNVSKQLLAFYNPALNPRIFESGEMIPRDYKVNIPMINREDENETTLALSGGVLGMRAFFATTEETPFPGLASVGKRSVYRVKQGRVQLVDSKASFSEMVAHRYRVPHAPLPFETASGQSGALVSLPYSTATGSANFSIVSNQL